MRKLPVKFCLALLAITVFSGCALIRKGDSPLDYRDSLVIPAGTTFKDVPFYVNGKDKEPTFLDFVTDSEGVFFSNEGLKAVKK